jgi:hypothetical protein
MFRIKGKGGASRAAASRTGIRVRRLPTIMSGGALLKIHPNRHITLSEEGVRSNFDALKAAESMLTITRAVPPFGVVTLDEIVSTKTEELTPGPVVETKPEPEPVVESEPEPVVESEPEPVVESEPEPVVESSDDEPKKTRRKRRTKKAD